LQQQLKTALWSDIGKMVDEAVMRQNRNATPQFIGALTEMVWTQIGLSSFLLSSFVSRFIPISLRLKGLAWLTETACREHGN
jgi:hypothetical protein